MFQIGKMVSMVDKPESLAQNLGFPFSGESSTLLDNLRLKARLSLFHLGLSPPESLAQNPALHGRNPRTMLQELRRRNSAAIYGWDCPVLIFIYPGFDCGSPLVWIGESQGPRIPL